MPARYYPVFVTGLALALGATLLFVYLAQPGRALAPIEESVNGFATSTVATSSEPVDPTDSEVPKPEGKPGEVPKPSVPTSTELLKGMKMTFSDEFNTFSRYLDSKGNVTCEAGGRGTWQTVFHFCSRTIFGNHDAQIYVDPAFFAHIKHASATTSEADPENSIRVNNGILSIKVEPASAAVTKAAGSWARYTSGLITTQFSFAQKYGYFEARIKLPAGKGVWPAFWLLPVDKSWPPEIDVLETFGNPSDKGEGKRTEIHYASHVSLDQRFCGDWVDVGVDVTKDFHTYGVDWQPSLITYYFDGKPYATCPPNPKATQPFYMLLNVAVGSQASWSTAPSPSNTWPVYMYVDYVRAYQKK